MATDEKLGKVVAVQGPVVDVKFSSGEMVPGINDIIDSSCSNVHERLNVNKNTLPSEYYFYTYIPVFIR